MGAAMDARILLVEDDPSIREVTAIGLRNAGFTVETAADGAAGLERFAAEPFDLVLLDIMLPRARRARGLPGDPARLDDPGRHADRARRHHRRRGRPRGGRRRLRQEAVRGPRARRPRPRGAAPGRPRPRRCRSPASRTGRRSTSPGGPSTRDGAPVALTRTEFDLLAELTRHAGQVLTRDVLLDRIWGYDYLGDSRLVDVAIGRLRAKIEADPATPELILTVRGAGYKAAR